MKKFNFPLEGAARVRDMAVRAREVDLAGARRSMAASIESHDRTRTELARSVAGGVPKQVVAVRDLLEGDRERQRLRAALDFEEAQLVQWAERVDHERDRLMVARRDAQAIEKLRERRYIEFLREVVRQEQKVTDEAAGRGHRAKKAA